MPQALDDLAQILSSELPADELASALLKASSESAASALPTLRDFHGFASTDWRICSDELAWACAWRELARIHPQSFSVDPSGLTALGQAYSYAEAHPGLRPLRMREWEREHHELIQAALFEVTCLPALAHPPAPKLVTSRCLALRAYPRLVRLRGTALTLANEPRLKRPILITGYGLRYCRELDREATLSRLALTVCHEQLHAAFADAARTTPQTTTSPFCYRVEEAAVCLLVLACELILGGYELTRKRLQRFCHLSPHPELTDTLTRALKPSDDALASVVDTGRAAASGSEQLTIEALNQLSARPRRALRWSGVFGAH